MSLPSWRTRMQAVAGQIWGFKPRAPATQEREGSVELWLALTGRSPAICVHCAPPAVLKCSVSTRAHPIYD